MARTEFVVAVASIIIVAGVVAIPLASPAAPVASPPASAGSSSASADPNGLVGAGCAPYSTAIPTLASKNATAAISSIPTLSSFSDAIGAKTNTAVNLTAKLDGSQNTIFVPVDAAFAKLPVATLDQFTNAADATQFTKVLEYHVVPTEFAPGAIGGVHTTLQGETLLVVRNGNTMTVAGANVICGGIHTADATLYLIDTVLAPPSAN